MRSRTRFRWFGTLLVFVLARGAAGCGTTEAVHADGQAPDGADVTQLPSCLRTLFAACPADGVCHSNDASGARQKRYCYASGVRADYSQSGGCAGDGRIVLDVRKPDGSPCYTAEISSGYFCESEGLTWKDPSGLVIATGVHNSSGRMIQCASGGEPESCNDSPQCQLSSSLSSMECSPGDCP